MKRSWLWILVLGVVFGPWSASDASLIGPWFSYECKDLGFRIPVANGWKVTEIPDGIVFAMQFDPKPYVRLAIGRIPIEEGDLEQLIAAHLVQKELPSIQRRACRVAGQEAIEIEGLSASGSFREIFLKQDHYYYWIGFAADRKDLWSQYGQTFNIIVEGFRFI